MNVQEIEEAIAQLSPEELAELSAWLADYEAQVWNEEIARDLEAGRLDALLKEIEAEYTEATPSLEDKLVARPVVEPQFTLNELLDDVTEENLHRAVDTGPSVGQEAW